jgi:hypothetical protein
MYEDPDSLDCEAMILAAELYNYLVFFFPEHDYLLAVFVTFEGSSG